MNDKIKKILVYTGIVALLGGASYASYEYGKHTYKPKAITQRDLNADNKSDQVISTYGGKKFIFMNDGTDNYMRLKDYMRLKQDEIVRQTEDIK